MSFELGDSGTYSYLSTSESSFEQDYKNDQIEASSTSTTVPTYLPISNEGYFVSKGYMDKMSEQEEREKNRENSERIYDLSKLKIYERGIVLFLSFGFLYFYASNLWGDRLKDVIILAGFGGIIYFYFKYDIFDKIKDIMK